MADHSLGGSMYSLKAIRVAGGSPDDERNWQNEQLQPEIKELAISGRKMKEMHFKL
jgi:hypothetical protein